MIVLSREQILLLHEDLIMRYGGTCGIRDEKLLDSAMHAPFQSFDGNDLFPSIIEKAVHLGYGLIKDHPFLDGNKRIGALAMLTMLDLNHISLHTNSAEVADIILKAAANEITEEQLLNWVHDRLG